MPVPATTGQLRTKVDDMEIGDYIQAYCDVTTGWQFGERVGKTELPVSGVAVDTTNKTHQNYFFYFVKVAKGLLVADRNWYHTVSWDSLNAWKNIQGYPINNLNIIPPMDNNISPNGVASASEETIPAWKAFDGSALTSSLNECWRAYRSTGWISYQFSDPKIVNRYTLTSPGSNWASNMIKDWVFQGSNDGIVWVTLHTVSNQTGWGSAEKRSYIVNNTQSFMYYRFNISATNGGPIAINMIEMMSIIGVIRSLTGGVAYADASGNKSLSNQNKGAWPTDNEWDKYIVNFPPSLIQFGKSLDDVFHISGVITLTQDTPTVELGSSTKRIARGYTKSAINLFFPESSLIDTSGFRPAFEYVDK
ncbi:SUN domain-containing protein [Bacillus sp. ILBB4]|jgi:F5/8 type C domain|nr:SUN domain-containing protein [Bacillus sp. ILBB4]